LNSFIDFLGQEDFGGNPEFASHTCLLDVAEVLGVNFCFTQEGLELIFYWMELRRDLTLELYKEFPPQSLSEKDFRIVDSLFCPAPVLLFYRVWFTRFSKPP